MRRLLPHLRPTDTVTARSYLYCLLPMRFPTPQLSISLGVDPAPMLINWGQGEAAQSCCPASDCKHHQSGTWDKRTRCPHDPRRDDRRSRRSCSPSRPGRFDSPVPVSGLSGMHSTRRAGRPAGQHHLLPSRCEPKDLEDSQRFKEDSSLPSQHSWCSCKARMLRRLVIRGGTAPLTGRWLLSQRPRPTAEDCGGELVKRDSDLGRMEHILRLRW